MTTCAEQSRIDQVCRGWSDGRHWRFFERLLEGREIRDICILGVYYGRDIAYLSHHLRARGVNDYRIVGVDKFEDSPCEDWPIELRSGSWEDAGFGPAPSLEAARENLEALGIADRVELHAADVEDFFARDRGRFDFVYVDTSHDLITTQKHIECARRAVKPDGWLGGDDFSDHGTWGVATAVSSAFRDFEVFDDWIWLAPARPDNIRAEIREPAVP